MTRGRRGKYLRAGGGEGGAGGGVESARKSRARAPETSAKVGYSAPMPPAALSGRRGAVAHSPRGGGGSGCRGPGDWGFWKSLGGVAVRLTGLQGSSAILKFRASWDTGGISPIKLTDDYRPNLDSNPAHGNENCPGKRPAVRSKSNFC